ncbi:MAG: hypothetical protein PHO66_03550 [Eubacteriales bacterium]|nr:hypothetical protein [Eubacteriales bacterium]
MRRQTDTGLRVALHTPAGKLTAQMDEAGAVITPFVRHPRDIDRLCSYLKDVEYLPNPAGAGDVLRMGWLAAAEFDAYWAAGTARELRRVAPQQVEACVRLLKKLQAARVALCLAHQPAYLVLRGQDDDAAEKLYARHRVPLLRESLPGDAPQGKHVLPLVRGEDIYRQPDGADPWMARLDAGAAQLPQTLRWLAAQRDCRGVLVENCDA